MKNIYQFPLWKNKNQEVKAPHTPSYKKELAGSIIADLMNEADSPPPSAEIITLKIAKPKLEVIKIIKKIEFNVYEKFKFNGYYI